MNHSAPFGQHLNPLNPLFLIAVSLTKIMQFLLIGFHCGQGFKFKFQVWSIEQILALFLFPASKYYRANWINNAAIIVWFLCVSQKKIVCVLVILEKEKLYSKSLIQAL